MFSVHWLGFFLSYSELTSPFQEWKNVWRDSCKICAVEGRLPIQFSAHFKRFCLSLSRTCFIRSANWSIVLKCLLTYTTAWLSKYSGYLDMGYYLLVDLIKVFIMSFCSASLIFQQVFWSTSDSQSLWEPCEICNILVIFEKKNTTSTDEDVTSNAEENTECSHCAGQRFWV